MTTGKNYYLFVSLFVIFLPYFSSPFFSFSKYIYIYNIYYYKSYFNKYYLKRSEDKSKNMFLHLSFTLVSCLISLIIYIYIYIYISLKSVNAPPECTFVCAHNIVRNTTLSASVPLPPHVPL